MLTLVFLGDWFSLGGLQIALVGKDMCRPLSWMFGRNLLIFYSGVIVLQRILIKSFFSYCQCLIAVLLSFPFDCLTFTKYCNSVDLQITGR